jgi:hypothetical protein
MNLDCGLFPHRSTAEHRALPFFSPSRLGALNVSPAECLRRANEPEETRAMRFGTMAHGEALEGGILLPEHWIEKPAGMNFGHLDGKAWKLARLAEDPEAIFVPAEDFERAAGAAESLRTHPLVAEWLKTGLTEVSLVWVDAVTGIKLKGRTDLVVRDSEWGPTVWDLKMLGRGVETSDALRAIMTTGTWMQVPFYASALEELTGVHHGAGVIAAGPDAPWPVECYLFPDDLQEAGLRHGRELLRTWAECEATGIYPADTRYNNPRGNSLSGWPRFRK